MRYLIIVMVFWVGNLTGANLLNNPDFEQDFKGYFKTDAFSLDQGILNIRGVPQAGEKVNGYQKLSQTLTTLPAAECPNHELSLSFQANIERISGRLEVAIREIDVAGKTIRYHVIPFTKWDTTSAWQDFSRTFKLSSRAAGVALYIVAYYLDDKDQIQLRKLRVDDQK